jgi:hypothetical protein
MRGGAPPEGIEGSVGTQHVLPNAMMFRPPFRTPLVERVLHLHVPVARLHAHAAEGPARPLGPKGAKRLYSSSFAAMARASNMPPIAVVFMPWPPKAVAHHLPLPV